MAFSERQKLAEEIIFLSEKRGITANYFASIAMTVISKRCIKKLLQT
jgi:hypothetical protein